MRIAKPLPPLDALAYKLIATRVWRNRQREGDCITVPGKSKYVHIWYKGRDWQAHRVILSLKLRREVRADLVTDHICNNTRCINPAHLREITDRENIDRSPLRRAFLERTHCKHGHELTPDNLMVIRGVVTTRCLTCHRISSREAMRRQRAAQKLESPPSAS